MPTSSIEESEHWSRQVGGFTRLPQLVRELGVDPATVLAESGVEATVLDHPANRIGYSSLLRLLTLAAQRTQCHHFGLLLGSQWSLADAGPLGHLVRHAPTVGVALQEFVVQHHLNSEAGAVFLLPHGPVVDLGYAIYMTGTESTTQYYDAVIAAAANLMRELCGGRWVPSEVLFSHSPPPRIEPYRAFFRAPLRFNREYGAVRFPATCLSQRVEGANLRRYRQARADAAANQEVDFIQRASRSLRVLLLAGRSSGDHVAEALALHRRTLNRRLKAQGTTFQQVLDRVRFAVAQELLRDSGLNTAYISGALGYEAPASFIRAFRRWTGTTPMDWKQLNASPRDHVSASTSVAGRASKS